MRIEFMMPHLGFDRIKEHLVHIFALGLQILKKCLMYLGCILDDTISEHRLSAVDVLLVQKQFCLPLFEIDSENRIILRNS